MSTHRIRTRDLPWNPRLLLRAMLVVAVLLLAALSRPAVIAGQTRPPAPATSSQPAAAKAPAKAPATAPAGSCTTAECHAAVVRRPVVHGPVSDDCTTCHTRSGNAHAFTLAAEGADLCTTCHEVQKATDKFVHGPVATGDCVSCHDPHGGTERTFVRAKGSALCLMCHIEMEGSLKQHRYTHAPVKTECVGCHNPHASPNKYQLKAVASSLCFSCHTELQQRVTKASVKHDALTMDRQCLGCHEPHVADVKPQLRGATMTLCLACHDRELDTPTGKIQDIKTWLAANPEMHGPIKQQDCVACHRPHESAQFRLLSQDYPAKFYSGFEPANYALCFTCHEPDLVRVERTTTLTGFRDGDRNLHFVHVNRPEKGRTCRACHEVHSSMKPRHIREKVPFGAWALPIKYESREGGGRCSPGCHVPYDYKNASTTTRTSGAADVTTRKP